MRQTVILSRKWEYPGQQTIVWLLAISGVYLLFLRPYAGMGILFVSYLMTPVHLGACFDLQGKRYRLYRSWAGVKLGKWQPLPPVRHVVLKYHAHRQPAPKRQWSTASQVAQQYILMLSVANSTTGIILRDYAFEQLEEARLTAATLAATLGVDAHEFRPHAATPGPGQPPIAL